MKMDVEGHECRAFNGTSATEFFGRCKVHLVLMEWLFSQQQRGPCLDAMLDFLEGRGFVAYTIDGNKFETNNDGETNIYWLHQ